ncbi:hypothetical protein CHS0354_000418 [Potamilus streckersoni]|uniref:Smr domain-containing protein n=1 Tax=Potamilus streckersoni TaxID=2493646 RepID=A0AAE0T6J2_9BIVA|nr:hypothetical protein CHS0354_000418 [Potamilus streckersoni]
MGESYLHERKLFSDYASLMIELKRIKELTNLFLSGTELPIDHFPDTRHIYKRAAILESGLDPLELIQIARAIKVAISLRRFFNQHKETYQECHIFFSSVWIDKTIQHHIMRCIDVDGSIFSTASETLFYLRKSIDDMRDKIQRKYAQLQRRYSEANMLMDEGVTIRNGRLALGFRIEHKYEVPGVIHGFSQSGRTVFIEPYETLPLQNQIVDLEIQESVEIIRILKNLTEHIRTHLQNLLNNQALLQHFDSIYAKAKYAVAFKATSLPQVQPLCKDLLPHLDIVEGHHPVLLHQRSNSIPLSVEFTLERRQLIISGPNAGGKTLALKTVGLLSYMVQSGYLVPCSESSTFSFFDQYFIEIGDSQSIESDLSSFSSHLDSLYHIYSQATSKSLILIDEICLGTSPSEGGAFAEAILETLKERGAITVVTTHLDSLKLYASKTKGAENASMRFDNKNFLPTYQLQMQIPGTSYALELAERKLFPPRLIQTARQKLGETNYMIKKLATSLSELIQTNYEHTKQLQTKESEIVQLKSELEFRLSNLQEKERKRQKEQIVQTKKMLMDAKNELNQLLAAAKANTSSVQTLSLIQKDVSKRIQHLSKEESQLTEVQATEDLRLGDKVRMLNSASVGTVIFLSGSKITVDMGNFNLKTSVNKVIKVAPVPTPLDKPSLSYKSTRFETDNLNLFTLDVRGITSKEVINKLEAHIDKCLLGGLSFFKIIHGHGSDILRKCVGDFLKKESRVNSFRIGDEGIDGSGVTIVNLTE